MSVRLLLDHSQLRPTSLVLECSVIPSGSLLVWKHACENIGSINYSSVTAIYSRIIVYSACIKIGPCYVQRSYETLKKFQEVKKRNQSIKRDLNIRFHTQELQPLHHHCYRCCQPLFYPFHRQTLETNPANHWKPIPKLPSPSHPYHV